MSRWLIPGFLCLCFVLVAFVYGRPVIQNDGVTYYSLARSLVRDGDFDLANEAGEFRGLRVFAKRDHTSAAYSCGFALLYAPFLLAFGQIPALSALLPYAQNVLFPFSDGAAVLTASALFGLCAIFLALRLLASRGEKPGPAAWISVAAFAGTPALFYSVTTPSFAHASDVFLTTAAFVLVALPTGKGEGIRGRNILLGFVLGFSVLLRNVNVVLLPPLIAGRIYIESRESKHLRLAGFLEIAAGGLLPLIVQLYYNQTQYGWIFKTGYSLELGSGHPPVDWYPLHCIYRLFVYPPYGLFVWCPVAALGLVGLVAGAIRRKTAAWIALGCITAMCATICYFHIIGPGASFGHRYLTHFYIFWVLGLQEALLLPWRKIVAVTACVLVLWTFLLFNAYYINTAVPENRKLTSQHESVNPVSTLVLAAKTGSNPFSALIRSLNEGPFPTLQHIVFHPDETAQSRKEGKAEISNVE